ncbi:MAG: hypothetical protein ACD_41C00051G0005 [uncultured bacterium]|nr:MAG: hypothetical protein ACD_41C00051G0005 [uncultured bacterium]HBY73983.1 hypothetical protein [Candidatus Kerfeldbacteria bacterium]
MPFYPKPYECSECSAYPDAAFNIFTPANDWIMTFPEQHLFHVHFGEPTFPEAMNTAQAEFLADYYVHTIQAHSQVPFYFILDMERIDNSELVSHRAKQIYRILLEHPQLVSGAVYGATTDMQAIIQLLSDEADKPVHLVKTKQEADQLHQRWLLTQ